MRRFTFPGGIHPEEHKSLTEGKPIREIKPPDEVIIPLSQHTGSPAKPIVEKGGRVKVGTKIGELTGFISANIHSSVSGEIKKVDLHSHPAGGNVLSVFITNDGKDECEDTSEKDIDSLSAKDIIGIVKEAGIVGLGGAAFPTYVKLSPPRGKSYQALILNGSECEPYLTCDCRLMVERPEDLLLGGRLIARAIGVKRCIIAIEENKPDAIGKMDKLAGKYDFELAVLRTKYPEGAEKQLIWAIAGSEVPTGGLPVDVGMCVHNVGTALAVYEAARFGKPLIERVVTVTGAVKSPSNFKVRIGTSFKKLVDEAGGYLGEPGKLIAGGPMMGISQYTDEVPVVKGTTGIFIQKKEESVPPHQTACIKCSRCVDVCPMRLLPTSILAFIERGDFSTAKELGVLDCMECGSCEYVCPARRPLIHNFKLAKVRLR
ncbi:electron transport complex subunit RsxC [candidate division WOR-3 bacterium JGI_Cruoil_03_44_89]|uniref:Ion-translocating oxidoreductase complex subunit C n=1 Tax=candidate division WOR-3 bacterium JGI_Cruoil_03_44_89 TaxID=1973748 RepID=A0A235BT54_UNCW3|nr:MAG: electron transport complex subunit RsxC [candidate division WOR-3 bacterium JGI_Cruoil_03_44_89]